MRAINRIIKIKIHYYHYSNQVTFKLLTLNDLRTYGLKDLILRNQIFFMVYRKSLRVI
jgi:hypothetical protein